MEGSDTSSAWPRGAIAAVVLLAVCSGCQGSQKQQLLGARDAATETAAGGKSLGRACTEAEECGSGFCVDGFCCESPCDAVCMTCGLPTSLGTCGSCVNRVRFPCASDTECASQHCVAGVCCSSACSGPCRSCNQLGSEGVCLAHNDGTACGNAQVCQAGSCGPVPDGGPASD